MSLESFLTALAVIVSVISIGVTFKLGKETEALQARISKDESTAASRRFFVDLWDKMKGVSEINPQSPVGPDVQTDLNVLELIALCYEGNIVDRRMVFLAFGKMYHLLYTQIEQISVPVPGMQGTGPRLLGEAPVINRVHDAIREELKREGQL